MAANRKKYMESMEAINVRLFNPTDNHLVTMIFEQLLGGQADLVLPREARLFKNRQLPGDLSIQLFWEVEQKKKTPLGALLAEALRSMGMVNHFVWKGEAKHIFSQKRTT